MISGIGVRLSKGVTKSVDLDTFKQWCVWLKEAGFDVVDVPELTHETKRVVEDAGLLLGSFDVDHVPQLFSREKAKRALAVDSICRQIAQAAELGGQICFMCLIPEDQSMPRRESFDLFCEVFPAVAAQAERSNVRIVIEGWPGPKPFYPTLGCTPEMLRAMFAAVPSPAFCFNYDPSHLVRQDIDYMRFLNEFADRIAHVHAKDCVLVSEQVYLCGRGQSAVFDQPVKFSEGPWRYTVPGEGTVNWAAVAFELEKIGYQGAVCIELEDHRYAGSVEDRRRGLRHTLSYLNRYFR
jgi:sugar phosphate isomerase/epimerase